MFDLLFVAAVTAIVAVGVTLLVMRRQVMIDGDRDQALVAGLRQQLLEDRDGLVRQVLDVAGERLDRHVTATTVQGDHRDQVVGAQLSGVHEQLDQVRSLVMALGEQRERGYGELTTRLQEAQVATATLSQSTESLVRALGSSQTRGQWGERLAEDVLRHAGFLEGVSYVKQTAMGRGRPDFTFPLPGGRMLHMDVKFPLDNYLVHLKATTDETREAARRQFLRDVRTRIKELSSRDYIDPANGTLDQVLLFLPNEAIYGFVHEQDPTLMDLAMERRVILCSPLTLFSVLGVVRQAVDDHVAERRSGEILELLAGFQTQWGKFTDRLDALDSQVDTVRRTIDDVNGVRRRQLERQLDRVDDLRRGRTADGVAAVADGTAHVVTLPRSEPAGRDGRTTAAS